LLETTIILAPKLGDWIDCYETEEEAITSKTKYRYDWYEIVDLREWMNR
jgi:hypothetical protein